MKFHQRGVDDFFFKFLRFLLHFCLISIEMAKKKTLNREQIRLLLHFQWLQGVYANDAARAINSAYGSKTLVTRTARNWHDRFEEEGMQLKDRSGRPRKVDHEAVVRAIQANPTMTTRMLGDDFDCSHTEIELILHEAGNFQ